VSALIALPPLSLSLSFSLCVTHSLSPKERQVQLHWEAWVSHNVTLYSAFLFLLLRLVCKHSTRFPLSLSKCWQPAVPAGYLSCSRSFFKQHVFIFVHKFVCEFLVWCECVWLHCVWKASALNDGCICMFVVWWQQFMSTCSL